MSWNRDLKSFRPKIKFCRQTFSLVHSDVPLSHRGLIRTAVGCILSLWPGLCHAFGQLSYCVLSWLQNGHLA